MRKLSLQEANEIIEGNGVILFTSENCNVCKTVKKTLENQDKIGFYEVLQDEEIVHKIGLKTVPIVIKFRNGKQIEKKPSIWTYDAYMSLVD